MLKHLPQSYKPKGHPRERLAYINSMEAAMLKMMTDGKSNMTRHGVPSFYMETTGGFSGGTTGIGTSSTGKSSPGSTSNNSGSRTGGGGSDTGGANNGGSTGGGSGMGQGGSTGGGTQNASREAQGNVNGTPSQGGTTGSGNNFANAANSMNKQMVSQPSGRTPSDSQLSRPTATNGLSRMPNSMLGNGNPDLNYGPPEPTGPSPLMQEAMRRNNAQTLAKQYSQYRSPPGEQVEDLTRAAYDKANPTFDLDPSINGRLAAMAPPTSAPFRKGANPGTPPGYAQKYFNERYPPTGLKALPTSGQIPQDPSIQGRLDALSPPQTSPAANAARIAAISRGPGLSDPSGYQKAITAVSAYPETPSGTLDPAFNRQLNTAALNREPLFNLQGGTPEQKALVDRVGPDALLASGRYGLDARTLMGQALTESTTKRNPTKVSTLAGQANNLFGIKAVGKPNEFWNGATLNMPTKEVVNGQTVQVQAPFRSYASPEQSVYDYARLMGTPRYQKALAGKTSVPDQLAAIRGAGYATHNPTDYVNMAMNNVNNLSVGNPQTQIADAASKVSREQTAPAPQPIQAGFGLSQVPASAMASTAPQGSPSSYFGDISANQPTAQTATTPGSGIGIMQDMMRMGASAALQNLNPASIMNGLDTASSYIKQFADAQPGIGITRTVSQHIVANEASKAITAAQQAIQGWQQGMVTQVAAAEALQKAQQATQAVQTAQIPDRGQFAPTMQPTLASTAQPQAPTQIAPQSGNNGSYFKDIPTYGGSSPNVQPMREAGGSGLSRLPRPTTTTPSAPPPVVVAQGPDFTWIQWEPGSPPVQIPTSALIQGAA